MRPPLGTPLLPHLPDSKTEVELTCIKIRQHVEKERYQRVVEMLRELPHNFILKCLEGFPFKSLNFAVPDTFPIWETLLTKLHNSEEGYIPQFPYAACDELVLQIARLLEVCEGKWRREGAEEREVNEGPGDNPTRTGSNSEAMSNGPPNPPLDFEQLAQDCKRVLKKVYMQYNDVLEHLYKRYERVQHALYTLSLHMPLGTDHTAVSLQHAIMEEVQASLEDYGDAVERLHELAQSEGLLLSEALQDHQTNGIEGSKGNRNGVRVESVGDGNEKASGATDSRARYFPSPPNPNQVQLHERLYFNQCVLTALKPSRRADSLQELMDILNERICGDKEVLAFFGNIRQRDSRIKKTDPVEPCLKRHLYSIECAISVLKEIEKELEITLPCRTPESPGSTSVEESFSQIVPVAIQSASLEEELCPRMPRRHSSAFSGECVSEELEMGKRDNSMRLSLPPSHRRPRSASPQKARRIPGPMTGGTFSSESSVDSSTNLASGVSVSVHDLHSVHSQPTIAFSRAQSLMTPHTRAVVAGKRKPLFGLFRNSLTNLSTSSGNVSGKKSMKIFRTGSAGFVPAWDKPVSGSIAAIVLTTVGM